MNTTAPNSIQPSNLSSMVGRLAAIIGARHYPAGDRSALRRWAPGQPVPLAFYRLWLRHVGADLPAQYQTEAWMLIAWAIVTLGEKAHDPQRPWGQALAEAGFSEGRLERLLSAPADVRADLFVQAVRFLAAKDERFDLVEAALYLVTEDEAKREGLARRIAQAFYRHLPETA
ncbi:CRISPR type I-E CasB/Cse2 [Tepidimonas alkaliphilus]|uniref:CRISPR type I-E CasB/Cse2 n=1 Tax=Tepidimonas alkaliphilus TaxID=2588942 RepID=A0A554WAJ7_9BURK|nr:type I-E CRISPR-associated protein Cse2/CasB [Tepidimonas alkaliphilus]TSE20599.1 CRISPR type I-E CasB/Cse2 [Tepidimonas alkaliphilus]